MTINKKCPYCANEECEVPTIDNGVGEEQCGQAYCPDCGAVEIPGHDYFDKKVEFTNQEIITGWYRGDKND